MFNLLLLVSLFSFTQAFYIYPDIFAPKPANKLICQLYTTDEANRPESSIHKPYLECPENSFIKIADAFLVTTDPEICPLQYTYTNNVQVCKGELVNSNVTRVLQDLCNEQSECVFEWNQLSQLKCSEINSVYNEKNYKYKTQNKLWKIDANNQGLNVTYTCSTKRPPCKYSLNFNIYSNKFI